jgi:hypothetical protein
MNEKLKKSLFGGSSLGLSAVAVIWIYHNFVTRQEYDKDYSIQQAQNTELWHAIHQQQNTSKPQ